MGGFFLGCPRPPQLAGAPPNLTPEGYPCPEVSMDSILMTFAIPNGNPNATALAGNQAREEAAIHSLEAPPDPNWKTYFSGWTLTPNLRFPFSGALYM